MLRVQINNAPIEAALRQAAARLDDMRPAYADIGEQLVYSTKQRFAQGIAPDGSPWAPKSPATLELYRRRGDRADPRPLHGPSGRLASEIAYLATERSVEVGSPMVYSGVMQRGAAKGAFGRDSKGRSIPWGTIPARVWLGLSDQDERDIIDIVDEHVGGPLTA